MALDSDDKEFVTWTIRNFPFELKNEIVGMAKQRGMNTSLLLQTVFFEWKEFKKIKKLDLK